MIGQSGKYYRAGYATWHTPVGAAVHNFVDVRDKGKYRKPCS